MSPLKGFSMSSTTRLKHGQKRKTFATPEYGVWCHIKERCYNKNSPAYKDYGGRGILMCDEWKDFVNFFNDMGQRPSENHSIDRIDNSKGYSPDNCRWATYKEQQRNRRDNLVILFDGVKASLAEHCERLGLKYQTVHRRIVCGADISVALQHGRIKRGTIKKNNSAPLRLSELK